MQTTNRPPSHLLDLQVHSKFSDGRFQLPVTVKKIAQRGIRVAALTEHDTLAHVPEILRMRKEHPDMHLVLGIEMSLMGRNRLPVDVLAYGFDPNHHEMRECVDSLLAARRERVRKTVATLRDLGFVITEEDVLEICPHGNAGKKQIAQAVVRRPENYLLLTSIGVRQRDSGAFHHRMLQHYDLGRVPLERKPLDEGTHAVRAAGGVCVLAHPIRTFGQYSPVFLKNILRGYQARGIEGLEVFYPRHKEAETAFLLQLARDMGLYITAGSDFHGRPGEKVGAWPDFGLLEGRYDVFSSFLERVGVPSTALG